MCVIAICEKRKLTTDEIAKMWAGNSHGAGMAWTEKGQVCYRKGFMKLSDFQKFYKSRSFSLPHIVHFRIASVGPACEELTMPFTCSLDSPLVSTYKGKDEALVHNGTYREWKEVLGTTVMATEKRVLGAVNDSRLCAILRYLVPAMLPEIARTSSSRFAVINPKGQVEWFGKFDDHNGIKTSNSYWKIHSRGTTTSCDASGYQLTTDDIKDFRRYIEKANHSNGKQDSFKWTPDRSDPRNYKSVLLHKDSMVVNGD
jgi:hypothetical protein